MWTVNLDAVKVLLLLFVKRNLALEHLAMRILIAYPIIAHGPLCVVLFLLLLQQL
jgi:hypothetical protein